MKKIALTSVVAFLCLFLKAQEGTTRLTLGSSVSSFMHQYFKDRISDQDLFKQPTLITFISSHCSSCITAIRQTELMQSKFPQLKAVWILEGPGDERSSIQKRFNRQNVILLSSDTSLHHLFPHISVPHTIWIKDNQIQAITNATEVTYNQLSNWYDGNPLNLPLKNDYVEYEPTSPLLLQSPDSSRFFAQTVVTGPLPISKNILYGSVEISKNRLRKYFINMNLLQMLLVGLKLPANRFFIYTNKVNISPTEVSQPERLCYEAILHPSYNRELFKKEMCANLGSATQLSISYKDSLIACFLLKYDSLALHNLKSSGGRPLTKRPTPSNPRLVVSNKPMSEFIKILNAGKFGEHRPVIVSEANDTTPVDIQLDIEPEFSSASLQMALRKIGLTLIPVQRSLPIVVIKDIRH
ncbi:hypothetical protein ABDK00_008400 [Niabella insulamsoli]|uniref:hypothetical protein n=1 Tax=Niabella insulamsoli TaxID=3144874 RepID=UPI0031FBCB93